MPVHTVAGGHGCSGRYGWCIWVLVGMGADGS